ncbi:hypothetical protein [Mycobacterium sp. 236(2023)]|uniref:hypothetical protein n=1 Tax=Mycobacterium sp. 236(2023) TaxID=3038163 RepID=UPI0024154AC0|nr:hypothetical protein [Mycobacterium sp. 236(2023)]MDG4668628.1 hypothetical protein [Mycobacterium sp. 236(2023)]
MKEESEFPSPLIERPITFNYGYRMRCPTGHLTLITAEQFDASADTPCGTCGETLALSAENIVVRDPDDPALAPEGISSLVWYHTSTHANWPPPDYAESIAIFLAPSRAVLPPEVFADMLQREQTKALHVGTYESTIENMFRRRQFQDDTESQFYLYRVMLNLSADEIDPEIRHESHDEASQLTLDDLGKWKAVRYVNVEESPGSISLAINPNAIAAVQMIPLPAISLGPSTEPEIVRLAEQLDDELRDIGAQLDQLPEHDFTTSVLLRRANDEQALRREVLSSRRYEIWQQFRSELVKTYLPGVNPSVQENFIDVLGINWDESLAFFHDRFRAEAAVIINGQRIVDALAGQPWLPRHP